METQSMSCPERAIRVYDILALAVVALGLLAILWAGDRTTAAAVAFERSWADLALAIAAPGFMVAIMWLERRRGAGEDEYLKRLIGRAASTGVFFTIVFWVGWDILAGSWVPAPSGDQMIGVLLACVALAYGWARLRSS